MNPNLLDVPKHVDVFDELDLEGIMNRPLLQLDPDDPDTIRVMVTGGSSGIGRAVINQFKEQPDVYVINVSRTPYEGADENMLFDLSDHAVFGNIEQLGIITSDNYPDILINNAGVMIMDDFDIGTEKEESILRMWNLNTMAPYALSQALWRAAEKSAGECSIVNIASVAGLTESDFAIHYGMTKAALLSQTRSLAHMFAPRFRVNAVSPGLTLTNIVPGQSDDDPEVQRLIDAVVPLKFAADPEMIADMVCAVATNPFMTGSNVVIDGGEING